MKRLCIYLTYDKQKMVDAYIGYMLRELRTCADYLAVVCNELEIARGKEILEEYADDVFYRENTGADAGGFKDAMCRFIGWDKVLCYDELVLVNDSIFGPFRPMVEIFEEMDKKQADFWGLSKHAEYNDEGVAGYPEHIQSFFLVVRTQMLHHEAFRRYWENMPYFKDLSEVVIKHETRFTAYFAEQGFSFECLADMKPNDSKSVSNNFIQYLMLPYEIIKKRNFPFLKKKALSFYDTNSQTQENPRLALRYIEEHTNYNINLIWDNIIRTCNISDLQRSLHLQYVIPSDTREPVKNQNIMVVVIAGCVEAGEFVLEYLEGISKLWSITIIALGSVLLDYYENKGYQCVCLNVPEDCKALFDKMVEKELVCIIHDTDITGKQRKSYVGKSLLFNTWDNLLKNNSHVSRIIDIFKKESKLGMLVPPEANFGNYFGNMGTGWGENFEKVKDTAGRLQINCPITYKKPPFAHSEDFWIRGSILKKISESQIIEPEILPYLWCYIVQDAGYYSGIVESEDYAAINEINLQYYLSMLTKQLRHQCGNFNNFLELSQKITERFTQFFCRKNEVIYVYGTGIVAQRYRHFIPKIEAYIVSDGQCKEDKLNGIDVMYLSEVKIQDNAGIIVCLSEENRKQVVPLLEEKGWHNYFCV